MLDFNTHNHDPEAPMYCANHPKVETYLRCGKCGKPICAKCRVSTPVGFRCYDCANLSVLPTYAVSPSYYLKSTLWALAAATVSGTLMGFFPDFEFWAALLMGITVPEAVAMASNQKRGPGLQAVGMIAVFLGFVLSRVIMEVFHTIDIFDRVFRTLPIFQDWPFFINQYTIMWLALALFLAYRRLK
jgi:hypothetical protein